MAMVWQLQQGKCDSIENSMKALLDMDVSDELKDAMNNWIAGKEDADASKKASAEVLEAIENSSISQGEAKKHIDSIIDKKDYLIKNQFGFLAVTAGLTI